MAFSHKGGIAWSAISALNAIAKAAIAAINGIAPSGGGGGGPNIVQTVVDNFGGTSTATASLTAQTGDYIIVVQSGEGGTTNPTNTVSDPTHGTYSVARSEINISNNANRVGTETHYVKVTADGTYNVSCVNAASGAYGFATFMVARGLVASGVLDTSASNGAQAAAGADDTPSVAAGSATAQASNLVVASLCVVGSVSNVGIDAITGNSLTWANRNLSQDPNTENGNSVDTAVTASAITPSVDWGTLAGTYRWAATICVFKGA